VRNIREKVESAEEKIRDGHYKNVERRNLDRAGDGSK